MVGVVNIVNIIFIIGAVALVIVGFILYLWLRDSPENNLRRARKHHKIGERHHEKGNIRASHLHYEIARQYREKAMKQKGEN